MILAQNILAALARGAAHEIGKPVVIVGHLLESTSCCNAWHEYDERTRTVCKRCCQAVEPIYPADAQAPTPATLTAAQIGAGADKGGSHARVHRS
jgi:hypothetical protein